MRVWLSIAAINGALAVAFGAFAAHELAGRLDAHALSTFETGARYHMYHALAMGLAALAMQGAAARSAKWSAILFLFGIFLFCGSLYFLALTGMHASAFVAPFGGVSFLAGWVLLAIRRDADQNMSTDEHVLVAGSGIAGLGAALAFGDGRRRVTLIDRDHPAPGGDAEEAFQSWERRGATQLRHSHVFLGRLTTLIRERHPQLLSDLLDSGARLFTFEDGLPPPLKSGYRPKPGDDELAILSAAAQRSNW